jgi:hypothetical protein
MLGKRSIKQLLKDDALDQVRRVRNCYQDFKESNSILMSQ